MAGAGDRIGALVAHRVVIAGRLPRGGSGGLGGRGSGDRIGALDAADGAAGGADIDVLQHLRALPELRRDLHDDMVLVEGVVDRRYLPLAEGVVERVVDLARRDAEPRRRRAVDREIGLQPLLLLVGIDVGQLRHGLQRLGDARRPGVEIGERVGLQGELVLRVALAAADADVLHRLQEERGAGNLAELAAQPCDHRVRREPALALRLERDEDEARVGLGAAGEAHDAVDRRILAHDGDELGQLVAHRLEGDALIGLQPADHPPGILLRKEAFRHDGEKPDIEAERGEQDQQGQPRMVERPGQRALVAPQGRVEQPFARPEEPSVPAIALADEQAGAHHRRRRQRDDQRHQDGDREGQRELAEEAPDDAAHQQDGDEDGDQRDAHRQHGEADLARTLDRGAKPRHTGLDMARDVLEHDDRVVDDEAGRHGERHQRQIVEAVAEQVHHPERADQRHRHRDARHQRGAPAAQEGEDDDDDQHDRDQQRALDVAQRGADRRRAIVGDGDVGIARDRGLQLRQQRDHAIDGIDDVGVGLAVEQHEHRRLAVGEPGIAQILHRVLDRGDIRQPHRRTVAIGDDERAVLRGLARLIVGVDLEAPLLLLDDAFRRVGVGGAERGAHVLGADAVFEQGVRVELDAHRRQRAAAEIDLADAFDLRELLLEHRRRRVVELPLAQRVRGQSQDEDRRVGGIDLAIGRIAPEAGRQVGMRRIDRRLDVARGAVDVAREAELQRDAGRADGARRGHLGDVGDLAEMALERRRDAARHDLRAGAGQLRLHRDGGKIDLRQRRHRQLEKRASPPGDG